MQLFFEKIKKKFEFSVKITLQFINATPIFKTQTY